MGSNPIPGTIFEGPELSRHEVSERRVKRWSREQRHRYAESRSASIV